MTPEDAFNKAHDAGKRFPELEELISTDPFWSYIYARDIIKGRWVEAEDIIMINLYHSYHYALYVIKGKLPEKMHNMMILHAIKDPDDWRVKRYFEQLKWQMAKEVPPQR